MSQKSQKSIPLYENVPFALRGRDFDQNLRPFAFPFFEMMNCFPLSMYCGCPCMEYSKCQQLVMHKPISMALIHNIPTSDGINNKMYIRFYICHIGKTSYTFVCDLMQNDITYASVVVVSIHIDPNTRKPNNICKTLMNLKQTISQKITAKPMKNTMIERRETMKQSVDILSNYLKTHDINVSNSSMDSKRSLFY